MRAFARYMGLTCGIGFVTWLLEGVELRVIMKISVWIVSLVVLSVYPGLVSVYVVFEERKKKKN